MRPRQCAPLHGCHAWVRVLRMALSHKLRAHSLVLLQAQQASSCHDQHTCRISHACLVRCALRGACKTLPDVRKLSCISPSPMASQVPISQTL